MKIFRIVLFLIAELTFSTLFAQKDTIEQTTVQRIYGGRAGFSIPQGFRFISGGEADRFAQEIEDESFSLNRIGYLITDTATSKSVNEQIRILGFLDAHESGHIMYPNTMNNKEWATLLKTLYGNESESKINFLWEPITIPATRATSLGYTITNNDEEIVSALVTIPTKEGFWTWYLRFPINQAKVAKALSLELGEAISFDPALNYNNFTLETRTRQTYKKYDDYYNGKIFTDVQNNQQLDSPLSNASNNAKDVVNILKIREVAIAIGIILLCLVIIGLFFVVIALQHRKPNTKNYPISTLIYRYSIGIKARIGLFSTIYIIYIVLSGTFIVFLGYATVFLIIGLIKGWFIFAFALGIYSIFLDILIVIIIGGIWYGAITLFFTLIKPLIKYKEMLHESRLNQRQGQISFDEAPILFDLINETARDCGVEAPHITQLSLDFNASASFENPIRGIYDNSSPKVLSIGLPLFYILSIQELKAVIAHEFGHFSQKSTSVLTALWFVHGMISKLFSFDKAETQKYDNWLSSSNATWRLMGQITYLLISKVCNHILNVFFRLTRISNAMSRQMELDADKISAKCAGSSAAIKALGIINNMENIYDDYKSLIRVSVENHNVVPEKLMETFKVMIPIIAQKKGINPYACDFTESVKRNVESRIGNNDDGLSHPDILLRIEVMKKENSKKDDMIDKPGYTLLPQSTIDRIEEELWFSHLGKDIRDISIEGFKEKSNKELDERTFPFHLSVFFQPPILLRKRNWPVTGSIIPIEDWDKYRMIFYQYRQAIIDYKILSKFKEGKSENSTIIYLGKEYNRKNIPLEEHGKYIDTLRRKVEDINMIIMAHAMSCSNDESDIKQIYLEISNAQELLETLHSNFDEYFGWMIHFYRSPGYVTTEESVLLAQKIRYIEQHYKEFIKKYIDFNMLAPVLNFEVFTEICHFLTLPSEVTSINDTSQADIMFKTFNNIEIALNDLIYFHSKNLCNIIEGNQLKRNWKNSVAAVNEEQETINT